MIARAKEQKRADTAEARVKDLEAHRKEAGDALLSLTPGGSEYFVLATEGELRESLEHKE